MKLNLEGYTEKIIQNFTLTKEVKESVILENLEGNADFIKNEAINVFAEGIEGNYINGTLTMICGENEFIHNCYVSPHDGKYDARKCKASKKIYLNSDIDCLADGSLNIYDYNQLSTNTVQGDYETDYIAETTYYYFDTQNYTLQDLLNLFPSFDRSSEGWFVSYIRIEAIVQIDEDDLSSFYDYYSGHIINLYVKYVRISDTIQHSDTWQLIDGLYVNMDLQNAQIDFSQVNEYLINNNTHYQKYFDSTNVDYYKDVDISNTYNLNEIIIDIFSCTGKNLISNFFGINEDGSNPINLAYNSNYYKNIRIAQSFDVIREAAQIDSFGASGNIEKEKFIQNLCKLFNLCIIPEETIIRLEHISYYNNKGLTLTNKEYELSEIEVKKDSVSKEIFLMAAKTNTNGFYSVQLEYEKPKFGIDENVITVSNELFITDLIDCLNNEKYNESEYEDLFFLLSTDGNGNIIAFNKYLSMREIFTRLHSTQRAYRRANYEGNILQFNGYSLGMTAELKMKGNFDMYSKIFPFFSVVIDEGTFLITKCSIDEKKLLTLSLKK